MPGVDLTNARVTFTEKVLLDRVTITRNPSGVRNASFDDQTGEYVDPDGDLVQLATGVPAKAKELTLQESPEDVGAAPVVDKLWDVSLDFTLAPEMQIGDLIHFDTSDDDTLVGITMYVRRVFTGTIRVARKVQCGRRFDARDRS